MMDVQATKIQRMLRRKQSQQKLQADLQWKIFSDLDTIEENEMLALATFMKVLLDKVPDRKLTVDNSPVSSPISPSSAPAIQQAVPFRNTTTDRNSSGSASGVGEDVRVFEVFENERRAMFPPHAFGPGHLFIHPHFSDFTGKIKIDVPNDNLSALKPPPGCEWVGEWKICKEHTQTDSHGWSYGLSYDFLVSNCKQNKSIARSNGRPSRRRRHIRKYRKVAMNSHSSVGDGDIPPPLPFPSESAKRKSLYSSITDEIAIGSMSVDVHRPGGINPPEPDGNLAEDAPFDVAYASEVIMLCRSGKLIPMNVMSRLITECTEIVRQYGNFVHQSLPKETAHDRKHSRAIVVGDIHGNLSDLLYILDTHGLPSPTNRYVFNGDFVDRGDNSVEVMCILMALFRACPEYVILNRGNHEDRVINAVYGFQQECTAKYDDDTFNKLAVFFDCLPLFVLLEKEIFIVHGGLFIDRTVSFEDLEKINRFEYECQAEVPYPQCLETMETAEEQWEAFGKELHRNALWSDPKFEPGMEISHRGSGVLFGPDVAEEFMRTNNVKMIIRSHEVCKRGFYLPFGKTTNPDLYSPALPLLCTVFSASNYSNSGNEASVIVIAAEHATNSHHIIGTHLHYSVERFKTSMTDISLEHSNRSSLTEMVLKKKSALLAEFQSLDPENTGIVSRSHWAEVMQRVTNIRIRWLALLPTLVSDDCYTSAAVIYTKFLEKFSIQKVAQSKENVKIDIDALYGQRRRLEVIFNFFDVNGDGVITRDEFYGGCAILNEHLPEGQKLTDLEHILQVLDFDGSGQIELNEFFEAFRILDAKGMNVLASSPASAP